MPNTNRLAGHGLRSEGKPFQWSSESRRWVRTNALYGADTGEGMALCSCGTASPMLLSNAERKRWHAAHKQEIRERAASPDSSSEEG